MPELRHRLKFGPISIKGLVLLSSLAILASCRHPSDLELVGRLRQNSRALNALRDLIQEDIRSGILSEEFALSKGEDPSVLGLSPSRSNEYRRQMESACPGCNILGVPKVEPGAVLFLVSSNGILLKGSYKGYAYLPTPPGKLSKSFDDSLDESLNDCAFHFREVGGGWYIYYQNCV